MNSVRIDGDYFFPKDETQDYDTIH